VKIILMSLVLIIKKDKALKEAEKEQEYRGGTKYIPEVLEILENQIKTILKAESIRFQL